MILLRPRHQRLLAFGLVLAIALATGPAPAVETPPGSKNFTPPGYVPNYFSNESGPFQGNGGANATARNTAPDSGAVAAAPSPRRLAGHHASRGAKGRGHTRLAHGKAASRRQLAHAGAARGGKSTTKLARAHSRPVAGKTVAAKTGASSKGRRLAAAHG